MSDPCGNTGKPIWGCPCENCAPETYGPIEDKCLAEYDEVGRVENEWRLVHTCKEIRRLRQENAKHKEVVLLLNGEIGRLKEAEGIGWESAIEHHEAEVADLKADIVKLRKVVRAARQVRCEYPPSIRLLEQALSELDEKKGERS